MASCMLWISNTHSFAAQVVDALFQHVVLDIVRDVGSPWLLELGGIPAGHTGQGGPQVGEQETPSLRLPSSKAALKTRWLPASVALADHSRMHVWASSLMAFSTEMDPFRSPVEKKS